MDSRLVRALQILAIKSCEEPDDEDIYNRICRQFSQDYNMPLNEVYAADPIWVLRNYLEAKYQNLYFADDDKTAQQYQDLRNQTLYPEEVKEAEQSDDDWIAELRKMNEKNAQAKAPEPLPQEHNLVEDIPDEFKLPDSGNFGEE